MTIKKSALRMGVDAAMLVLLPVLMAYSLAGELLHEIAGVVMFALFIAHHILNRRATAAMFRGRQTPERLFSTLVNLLLFAVMLLLPLSGILLSKHLFVFLPASGLSFAARTTHLLCSYWGFALMGLHLGQHVEQMLGGREKHRAVMAGLFVLWTLAAALGAYEFVRRGLWQYMTLKTQFVYFDFDEPRALFFLSYVAMIAFFAWVGHMIKKLLHKIGGQKRG